MTATDSDRCKECEGGGMVQCPVCRGLVPRRIECYRCLGRGAVPCKACKTTGKVQVETLGDLWGIAPDATGDMISEDWVRKQRNEGWD